MFLGLPSSFFSFYWRFCNLWY